MTNFGDKTIGKIVSLLTLSVGIAIGFGMGVLYRPQQAVQAQSAPATQPAIRDVTPGVTMGSIGTNLILAHEVAADSVVVNGFDIMLMQQNILNYLGSRPYNERADIQNIINASRAATVYRLKNPSPPPVPSTEKKP